jgi:hypothetical protein
MADWWPDRRGCLETFGFRERRTLLRFADWQSAIQQVGNLRYVETAEGGAAVSKYLLGRYPGIKKFAAGNL